MNPNTDELIIEVYETLQGSLKDEKPGLVHVVRKITLDMYGDGLDKKNCIESRLSKLEDTRTFVSGWIAGVAFIGAIIGGLLVKLLFK